MRYMLLMVRDEERWNALGAQERVKAYEEALQYSDELRARGVYEVGSPLEPSSTATTVRLVQGRLVTTDGPFAETKEQLGGYSIVNVKDLDEALAVVRRHPLLRAGHCIEVRPMRTGPPQ